jgi:hypothetical protein
MARIRITGLDKLQARLKAAPREATTTLAGPLRLEAELIMTKSKRLTPVDVGTLRASGVVQSPDISRTKVTVEMGYGGAASAYALVQHERTDFTHTVGQAKFLEQPVKEAKSGFGNRVAKHLDLF